MWSYVYIFVCYCNWFPHITSIHDTELQYFRFSYICNLRYTFDHICGVMVSLLDSSVKSCWFDPWLGHTKDNEICICFFSAKYAALKCKLLNLLALIKPKISKLVILFLCYWSIQHLGLIPNMYVLERSLETVIEWSDMSTCAQLCHRLSNRYPTQRVCLEPKQASSLYHQKVIRVFPWSLEKIYCSTTITYFSLTENSHVNVQLTLIISNSMGPWKKFSQP